ncbi:Protein phosphatase 1 regulatory subunit 7 [Dictyocoela muelleri]|nr:Protein phosphatase 1 regulatory subunit 7 [Dictyocoela muelleri]
MTDNQVSLEHSSISEIPLMPDSTVEAILFRNKIKKMQFKTKYLKLVNLDLSDNKIEQIENLEMIPNIRLLDLSFNLIKTIDMICLNSLEELYLISNDLREIPKIECPKLKKLDLANNTISEIKNLEKLISLEELYLANNKIDQIKNLKSLNQMKILGLQNNILERIDCFDLPENIENIHLDENTELYEIINFNTLQKIKLIEVEKTKIKRDSLKSNQNVEIVYSNK